VQLNCGKSPRYRPLDVSRSCWSPSSLIRLHRSIHSKRAGQRRGCRLHSHCCNNFNAATAASFNPQNRICKEVALQRPKTGKFDYLGVPNHPAHSVAFEFFTDDYCLWLILKTLPEAPAFGGDMKAATASARVQRVRYSYWTPRSAPPGARTSCHAGSARARSRRRSGPANRY
jgi:hypothetical protein